MSGDASTLRVLVVATKCPWPPTDGGRLVLAETLRAVADAGAEVTLVCPEHEENGGNPASPSRTTRAGVAAANHVVVTRRARPWIHTLLRPGTPATIVRQTNDASLEAVERLVAERPFDVAHAEQLHALPMLAPARKRGIPIVLRAQNVESDLWRAAARAMPHAAPWLLLQAALLRRWEGRAVAGAAATAALTETDRGRLSNLAGQRGEVVHLAAPFPASLDSGSPLPGTPALVVAAGGLDPESRRRALVRRARLAARPRASAGRTAPSLRSRQQSIAARRERPSARRSNRAASSPPAASTWSRSASLPGSA